MVEPTSLGPIVKCRCQKLIAVGDPMQVSVHVISTTFSVAKYVTLSNEVEDLFALLSEMFTLRSELSLCGSLAVFYILLQPLYSLLQPPTAFY